MSKTIKSLMIKVTLAILMLAMVGFVFTTVNFRSAKAEETATGVFEFVGTSINVEDVTDGEAGYEDVTSAKITSIVDKTYYDAIEVKEGETLKFFTLVSTSDEDPTLEKVEGSENRIVVAYWYPDFTETRTEFTSNTYIANFPAERYASEFTVRVGYTVGETTEYVDSVKTSLVGVASQAINAGYTEDLSKYLGEAKTLVGAETAYAALNNGDTVKVEIPAMENVKAYIQGNTTATDVTVSEEGGKTYATLKVSDFANFATGKDAKVNFIGTCAYYTTSVKVINYLIKDEGDFRLFFDAIMKTGYVSVANTPQVHAVLANNLSLTDTYHNEHGNSYNDGACWKGSLDGQGFTLANIKGTSTNRGWFASCAGVTIKNIALVNMDLGDGEVFAATHGGGDLIIDNVYMDFNSSYSSQSIRHGLSNNSEYAKVTNSVLSMNYYNQDIRYPVFKVTNAGDAPTFENAIIISNRNTFIGDSTLAGCVTTVPEGAVWYKTQVEANTAINGEKPAGFGEDWVVSNGVLTFATAVDYLDDVYTIPNELTIGVSEDDIEGELNVTVGTYNLTTSIEGATIELTSSGDYTLSGNTLTINAGVTNGQEINLKATYVNPFWAVEDVTTSITLNVVIEKQFIDVKEQLVGLNRNSVMSLNLTDLGLTEATVVGATYNDVAVETPTISEGVLAVDLSGETVNTNGVLVVELFNNKDVVLNIPIYVVDFAIGNPAEFKAWYDATMLVSISSRVASKAYYVAMDNDVDMKDYTFNRSGSSTGYLAGEFDGYGHTISNITFSGDHLFEGTGRVNSTVRTYYMSNVAWVNIKSTGTFGQMFGLPYANMEATNCYFDHTATGMGTSDAFGFNNTGSALTAKNCVFKLENDSTAAYVAMFRNGAPSLTNCILISAQEDFSYNNTGKVAIGYDVLTAGNYHYTTQENANAAILADNSIVSKFDTNYWTLDKTTGELYWTTSKTNA